ncbi:hypothetical protein GDO78_005990 [Eleutherodactylus coqui]|uniref:Uncharacterized protein n=1 Tax=Eleutherodactylus coqui TaxID=57060 RepID=A0A8J6KIL4_ELECQ|nr:hypothetical protein GDO78_005990 [Eleutherodactylus coqui]
MFPCAICYTYKTAMYATGISHFIPFRFRHLLQLYRFENTPNSTISRVPLDMPFTYDKVLPNSIQIDYTAQ